MYRMVKMKFYCMMCGKAVRRPPARIKHDIRVGKNKGVIICSKRCQTRWMHICYAAKR